MVLYHGTRRGEGCIAAMRKSGYAAASWGASPGPVVLSRIRLKISLRLSTVRHPGHDQPADEWSLRWHLPS